jgi:hypothetical protein
MRYVGWAVLAVLAFGACGNDHRPNGVDAFSPPADAALDARAPDAPAMPMQAMLTVLANGQSVTSWTFPDTPMGATAGITLFVRNDGATTAALAPAVIGSDYAIVAANSSCSSSLAPAAFCHLQLTFAPSQVGSDDGTLSLGDPAAPFTLPLHAQVPLIAGLTTNVSSVDFGVE